jgi:hypothetical protein
MRQIHPDGFLDEAHSLDRIKDFTEAELYNVTLK